MKGALPYFLMGSGGETDDWEVIDRMLCLTVECWEIMKNLIYRCCFFKFIGVTVVSEVT